MSNDVEKRERTDKEVCDDVERLKEWLLKQPHLPHNIEEPLLRSFVRGTNTLQIAKENLDTWFTLRGTLPHLSLENRNPLNEKFQKYNNSVKVYFLPNATPEGYRVVVQQYEIGNSDYSLLHETSKLGMMFELALHVWPDMKGIVFVSDFRNVQKRIAHMGPTVVASFCHWFQKAVPMRLKKLVFIYSPPTIHVFLNTLVKPFISEKLFSRVVVSAEGGEFLKTIIPEDMIPADLGGSGSLSTELNDKWNNILKEKTAWFKEVSPLASDEKKRLPDHNNTYGIDGTFRLLAID